MDFLQQMRKCMIAGILIAAAAAAGQVCPASLKDGSDAGQAAQRGSSSLCPAPPPSAPTLRAQRPEAVPHQLWVKLHTDGRDAGILKALNESGLFGNVALSRENLLRKYFFRVSRTQWQWVLVQLPQDKSIFQIRQRSKQLFNSPLLPPRRQIVALQPNWFSPRVIPVPDRTRRRLPRAGLAKTSSQNVFPDDPMFSSQRALHRIGAPAAWRHTQGNPNIVVAVLDTGIFYRSNPANVPSHKKIHVDLRDNVWINRGEVGTDAGGRDKALNRKDDDGNGWIDDVMGIDPVRGSGHPEALYYHRGHGDRATGIIAAVGNNGIGVAGVCWRVKFMLARCFGHGSGTVTSWIGDSYEYVIRMRRRGVPVRLINNSWALDSDDAVIRDLVDKATQHGILSVCAAGNEKRDIDRHPLYPASYPSPGVIAVAASNLDDTIYDHSNYGVKNVDLAAPGDVWTVGIADGYGWMQATSAATPLVTGALALMLSKNPRLSVPQLRHILLNSVEKGQNQPHWPWRGKVASGGRLDLGRALANTPKP